MEIILEIISEKSLGVSGHLEICQNGREILQKRPSKFINPKLKVGTAYGAMGVPGDSGVSRRGDSSGEEIMAKHHGYLGV